MYLRVFAKTIFPALAMGIVFTLLTGEAEARWRGGSSGGSTGGSSGGVPEIGAGTAAAGLALVMGTATLVKDWYARTRSKTSKE